MSNKQQQQYLSIKHKHEEDQLKILKTLNSQGTFEHNGVVCWNDPLDNTGAPQPFRPLSLEEEYDIIYDKDIGEYRVLADDDEKKRRARKREYRNDIITQRRKNLDSRMATDSKTLWVDITGCAVRHEPWIKTFSDAPQMLARLAMLACHLKYNDRHLLKQRINGKAKMTRTDAARILGLNAKTFHEFWICATERGHIVGDDETGYELYMPVKYGRLQGRDTEGHIERRSKLTQILDTGVFGRLYNRGGYVCLDHSLRPLTPRDHHLIGKILQLAPYINIANNILCHNALCSTDNIDPLSTADIARLIGIDTAHSSRDVDRLCRLTFPAGEVQQYVLVRELNAMGKPQYVVNPLLLCHATSAARDKIRARTSFVATNSETGEVL